MYIGGGSEAALVNDARLGGFPATHFESYSQAADVGKASEWRSFQAKSSLPEKGKELFFWRSRWDSNPRASKG